MNKSKWGVAVGVGAFIAVLLPPLIGTSSTSMELALFGVLQFGLTLLFGWIVTTIVTEKSYEVRQKKFAIAAYRRLMELQGSFSYLCRRIRRKMTNPSPSDFEVIEAMTHGIELTITSAIADWADIIGDEMDVFDELNQTYSNHAALADSDRDSGANSIRSESSFADLDASAIAETLLKKIPASLRFSTAPDIRTKANLESLIQELSGGGIEFNGFHDETFPVPISRYLEGEPLAIRVDDVETRRGILTLYDPSRGLIGVITNKFRGPYPDFLNAVIDLIGSKFNVTLLSVEEQDGDRQYFTVRFESPSNS
jgi:hypothetical protein